MRGGETVVCVTVLNACFTDSHRNLRCTAVTCELRLFGIKRVGAEGFLLVGAVRFFFCLNEAKPSERSGRRRFLPIGQKVSSYRGPYGVPSVSYTHLTLPTIYSV